MVVRIFEMRFPQRLFATNHFPTLTYDALRRHSMIKEILGPASVHELALLFMGEVVQIVGELKAIVDEIPSEMLFITVLQKIPFVGEEIRTTRIRSCTV